MNKAKPNQTEGEPISIHQWQHFFKPEVRHAGNVYFSKGKMTSTKPSDTEVQAYIRGSTTHKINLRSPAVESRVVNATCTCPPAKKGNLCKHIWATLLKTEKDHRDFLDGKTEIDVKNDSTALPLKSVHASPKITSPLHEIYKAKQTEYKKLQYQKQKLRAKEFKKNKTIKSALPTHQPPRAVQDALYFFANNGFEFELPLDIQIISAAKKKLSRIFHPDAGGTHAEILKLNANFDILIHFIKTKATHV